METEKATGGKTIKIHSDFICMFTGIGRFNDTFKLKLKDIKLHQVYKMCTIWVYGPQ